MERRRSGKGCGCRWAGEERGSPRLFVLLVHREMGTSSPSSHGSTWTEAGLPSCSFAPSHLGGESPHVHSHPSACLPPSSPPQSVPSSPRVCHLTAKTNTSLSCACSLPPRPPSNTPTRSSFSSRRSPAPPPAPPPLPSFPPHHRVAGEQEVARGKRWKRDRNGISLSICLHPDSHGTAGENTEDTTRRWLRRVMRGTQKRWPSEKRSHHGLVRVNDEHLLSVVLGKAGRGPRRRQVTRAGHGLQDSLAPVASHQTCRAPSIRGCGHTTTGCRRALPFSYTGP